MTSAPHDLRRPPHSRRAQPALSGYGLVVPAERAATHYAPQCLVPSNSSSARRRLPGRRAPFSAASRAARSRRNWTTQPCWRRRARRTGATACISCGAALSPHLPLERSNPAVRCGPSRACRRYRSGAAAGHVRHRQPHRGAGIPDRVKQAQETASGSKPDIDLLIYGITCSTIRRVEMARADKLLDTRYAIAQTMVAFSDLKRCYCN